MVLEGLGGALRATLAKIAAAGRIDEALVKEVVRDIQRALLQGDVNVRLALKLTKEIERRALSEAPPAGMTPREHVIRVVYDELVKILGTAREVPVKPQTVMLVGLYGQGKTTTAGKLARYFQRKGLRVGLVACDVHRPAAVDQLRSLAERVNAPFHGEPGVTDAPGIAKRGVAALKGRTDVIIVDTAGRDQLQQDLVEEMRRIFEAVRPDEKLLVLDATIGQQAGPQAKAFHDAIELTGCIITKLDGSAKGGGALSAVSETGAPVVFIGVGEHLEDLERFDAPRFISRLLGMGDLQTLLEKAQDAIVDEAKAEKTARKIMSGRFTLVELREQMEMLTGMGPLQKVMEMIPGFGGMKGKMSDQAAQETQERLGRFRVIMSSMTQNELENPEELKATRMKRIARGSGTDAKDVKELLKYYDMSRRAIKGFAGNRKMQKKLMSQLKFQEGEERG